MSCQRSLEAMAWALASLRLSYSRHRRLLSQSCCCHCQRSCCLRSCCHCWRRWRRGQNLRGLSIAPAAVFVGGAAAAAALPPPNEQLTAACAASAPAATASGAAAGQTQLVWLSVTTSSSCHRLTVGDTNRKGGTNNNNSCMHFQPLIYESDRTHPVSTTPQRSHERPVTPLTLPDAARSP